MEKNKKLKELNHIQVRQWWCAINSEAYCRQTKDITQSTIVDPW